MGAPFDIPTDTIVRGSLTASTAEFSQGLPRTELAQGVLTSFPMKLTDFVVHDAPQTHLPGTAANDDLGLYGTTVGTDSMYIAAGDIGGAASTRYARCMFSMPECYDADNDVKIRIHAGMQTTVCSASCTVDVQCYESDQEAGVGADLCTTAAQDMNNLVFADLDFVITDTNLVAGDILDMRIAVAYSDVGDAGVMIPTIGSVELLCDIRG